MRWEAGLAGTAKAVAQVRQVTFTTASGDWTAQGSRVVVVVRLGSFAQQALDPIVRGGSRDHEFSPAVTAASAGTLQNVPEAPKALWALLDLSLRRAWLRRDEEAVDGRVRLVARLV